MSQSESAAEKRLTLEKSVLGLQSELKEANETLEELRIELESAQKGDDVNKNRGLFNPAWMFSYAASNLVTAQEAFDEAKQVVDGLEEDLRLATKELSDLAVVDKVDNPVDEQDEDEFFDPYSPEEMEERLAEPEEEEQEESNNQVLFRHLKELELEAFEDVLDDEIERNTELQNALAAISKTTNAQQFRQAIIDHSEALGLGEEFVIDMEADANFFSEEGDEDLDNGIDDLRNLATEKEIIFYLSEAPVELLLQIAEVQDDPVAMRTLLRDADEFEDNPEALNLSDEAYERIGAVAELEAAKGLLVQAQYLDEMFDDPDDLLENLATLAILQGNLKKYQALNADVNEDITKAIEISERLKANANEQNIAKAIEASVTVVGELLPDVGSSDNDDSDTLKESVAEAEKQFNIVSGLLDLYPEDIPTALQKDQLQIGRSLSELQVRYQAAQAVETAQNLPELVDNEDKVKVLEKIGAVNVILESMRNNLVKAQKAQEAFGFYSGGEAFEAEQTAVNAGIERIMGVVAETEELLVKLQVQAQSKNKQLADIISKLTPSDGDNAAITSALDALSSADTSAAFRQAVIDHQVALGLSAGFVENAQIDDESFLSKLGDLADKNSIGDLRELAVEKQIIFSLASLPEQSLNEIINADGSEGIRTWLVSSGGSDLPLDDAAYDRIRKEASNRTVPFLIVKINERVVTLNTLYDEAIAAPDAVEFPQRIVKIEAELVQAMADLNKAEQFANSEDSKNKVALATTSLDQFKGRVDANRVALVKLVTDASTAIVNKPVIATETEHTALLEHVKGMNAAFNLMKIMAARSDVNPAIDDVLPLKVPRDNALKAFRPAEINFHLAKCQAELDRIKVSAIHPQEMGAAAKLPPLEASLQRAKAALEKATASLLQTKEEKLVDVVPLTANVDLAKTKLQDLEREVTALKEKIINRTATGGLEFLPDNELFKKRLFIEKNGLLNFTDTVIRRENADTFNNEMNMSPTTQATADQGGSVAFENDSAATFQSVKLREGDVVRSHITFERPPTTTGPTPPAVGLLKQDHTGKVTNMSDMAKLTKEEQGVVALKQAQMLMNNYRPESGNIIIRGKNPEMANKVYAALLLLKESNPKFKNAEIKSFVPGCTGPGVLTRNSSFIETHLGTSASKDLREQISKDTGTFTSTRFARLKEINKLNKATPDGAKDYVLKEGDELDHKGTKTPRG